MTTMIESDDDDMSDNDNFAEDMFVSAFLVCLACFSSPPSNLDSGDIQALDALLAR